MECEMSDNNDDDDMFAASKSNAPAEKVKLKLDKNARPLDRLVSDKERDFLF